MSTRLDHVEELVLMISRFSDSRTRVALLLTCKRFFDWVVPVVWKKVKGAEILLSLIEGAEVEKSEEHTSLELPIIFSAPSLTRLKIYAPCVKQLEIFKYFKYRRRDYNLSNWKALLEYSESTPLLPNLTQLTLTNCWWFNNTENPQLPWLLLFISPSLLKYRMVRDPLQKAPIITNPRAGALLAVLQRRCPELNALEIFSGPGAYHDDENALITLQWDKAANIKAMPLQKLSTTLEMLREIGDMQTISQLQRLDIHYKYSCNSFVPLSTSEIEWPNLQHLSIYSVHRIESLNYLWKARGLVGNLTSVSLCIRDKCFKNNSALKAQLENLAIMLAQGSPNLNHLYLGCRGTYGNLENPGVLVTMLSHLTLKELQVYSGECTKAVDLQQNLKGMTFRCIHRLDIRDHQIDLSGLLYYAQSMPNLHYLRVQIRVPKCDRLDLSTTTPTKLSRFELCVASTDFEGEELGPAWEYASRLLLALWSNINLTLESRIASEHGGWVKILRAMQLKDNASNAKEEPVQLTGCDI
ncbi:hypothetical protein FRC12_010013 [Ceratobasidium sp. 428]|nr:hypothetical protein FRC12_010013 [Ceratobasidium sp. 428]